MTWNEAALRLLDIPADCRDGAERVAGAERWLGRVLPAAVGEWFRTGADRRLARLSDNHIADLASLANPDHARFLEAGLLLLETDSQHCCRWVTPLDGGDDGCVYLDADLRHRPACQNRRHPRCPTGGPVIAQAGAVPVGSTPVCTSPRPAGMRMPKRLSLR